MTVKRKHRVVDFIATSPRLGNVLRGAARRNKSLGRCAVIREIGGAGAHSASRARAPKLPTVMLSHVEDDYAALADHDLVSLNNVFNAAKVFAFVALHR